MPLINMFCTQGSADLPSDWRGPGGPHEDKLNARQVRMTGFCRFNFRLERSWWTTRGQAQCQTGKNDRVLQVYLQTGEVCVDYIRTGICRLFLRLEKSWWTLLGQAQGQIGKSKRALQPYLQIGEVLMDHWRTISMPDR